MDSDREIKHILEEILKWTKFEGLQKLKEVLEVTLNDDTKRLIYQLSDGKPSKEVASVAKVSDWTVRNYWKKWAVLGIMEACPKYKGRYWRLFSLDEVGIEVPEAEESVDTREEIVKSE